MLSSGMLRRVDLVRIDVSEEPSSSFIKVTRIGELGTTQAATSNRRTLRRTTNIPEDTILHSHRRENVKSYTILAKIARRKKVGNRSSKEVVTAVLSPLVRVLHATAVVISKFAVK
jgi:hypothetical protein